MFQQKEATDSRFQGLTANASTLDPTYEADWKAIEQKYRSPWYLAHRVDLHNSLKELAIQASGNGTPCRIHLRSKVVAIVSMWLAPLNDRAHDMRLRTPAPQL